MELADLQELGHCGDEANVGDNKQSNCSHYTAFPATVSSKQVLVSLPDGVFLSIPLA